MKKILALCLALMLSLSGTAFAYTLSQPGEIPVVDELLTYKVVAPDVTYIEDLNQHNVTAWVAENTNIQLVFEEIPDTELKTKVNLLLAAGDLPDMFMYCSFTASELADYGGQGLFLALNDLIAEHGIYTQQVYEQQETLPGAYTALDGNIYTLTNINECYHCFYAMRAWINVKWLENLGLEYPNTLEELRAVLTAFRDQDANGNGDPSDEIPFSGAGEGGWNSTVYPFLMNSFLHYDTSNLSVQDGTVIFSPIQEEFKEGLMYIADMISEGLIEREAVTQTAEQLATKGSGEIAMLGGFTSAVWWSGVNADDVANEYYRSREYTGLSPLEGPKGVRISPYMGTGVNVGHSVITTDCADPVPLFKMLDYMLSPEGTLIATFGLPGVRYELPEAGEIGINGKPALYVKNIMPADYLNVDGMENLFPVNRTSDFRLGEAADYSDPETQWASEPRLYNESAKYFMPYSDPTTWYPSVNMTAEEAEEIAFLKTQINDYVKEQVALFLVGERSFDDWDAYLAEFDALNLTRYMELIQSTYTRQFGAES